MEYMCLFYAAEDAEMPPNAFEECIEVAQRAHAAGAMRDARGLEDPTAATTVRVRDGKRLLTDGPFAETKEVLTGFFMLECKSLDDALSWAAQLPVSRYGCVEVRPVRALEP
ncbi:MAG TPA: YciI family protein [Candidatus Cybelea sp.]|nr:YciI family protein [Candidatus Cybelea sp.]